jgi:hypothetical protein
MLAVCFFKSLCENSKTLCHTRGGGYPALANPVRDETINILQFIHLSVVLTELRNGLDSCLRRNDKRFHTSSSAGITKRFRTSSKSDCPMQRANLQTFSITVGETPTDLASEDAGTPTRQHSHTPSPFCY